MAICNCLQFVLLTVAGVSSLEQKSDDVTLCLITLSGVLVANEKRPDSLVWSCTLILDEFFQSLQQNFLMGPMRANKGTY